MCKTFVVPPFPPSPPRLLHSGGVVNEVMRGVRLYFHKLVEGLPALAAAKAQLGLGHSYSRAKVKFNVHRSDNMIIQTISLLDQLDKDINTFAMRIRCVIAI